MLYRVSPSIISYSSQSSSLQCNYDIVEHLGLISRPGLQGKKQNTLLTSTGLYQRNSGNHEIPLKTISVL